MKEELMNALDDLYEVLTQIAKLMEEDPEDTANKPGVVTHYPFGMNFQELPSEVSDWVDAYKENLRTVKLDLPTHQFGMIYEAVNHLNWELSNDDGDWGYTTEQMKALEEVTKYLETKL